MKQKLDQEEICVVGDEAVAGWGEQGKAEVEAKERGGQGRRTEGGKEGRAKGSGGGGSAENKEDDMEQEKEKEMWQA